MSEQDVMNGFDDAPTCAKCDEDDKDTFTLEFCRKPGAKPVCAGYPDGTEHIHFTCACGYEWLMEPDDKDAEKTQSLPDFAKDCPKCKWGANAKWCKTCPEAEKEHMHMKCTACKFSWLSRPNDAPFDDEDDKELEDMREERRKVIRRGASPPPRHVSLGESDFG